MRVRLLLLVLAALAATPASGQPVRIVVLGSSNAFGTGPSSSDSTWVNRFRAYLDTERPGSEVINLARGGYLTYHLMPSDYVPPSGRQQPDPARNITEALARDPDAIIISLTSNDSDLGYTPAEQLARYDVMLEDVGDVPVYVTTTTPRSFFRDNGTATKAEKRRIQAQMKDSTLVRWGDRGIDFWTTLATEDSIPAAPYSAGDGVHFNNAGHRIFFERVVASGIVAAATPTEAAPDTGLALRPLPNPSPRAVEVVVPGGPTRLDVFDARGRRVARLVDRPLAPGAHRVPLDGLAAGLYILRLDHSGRTRTATVAVVR